MRSWNRVLLRLSRWPRRIAALGCLLLAGVSALSRSGSAETPHHTGNPVVARLRAGQVAVPLNVPSFAASGLVRVGDRVGVLTGPAEGPRRLVADHLRVLSVTRTDSVESDEAVVVVAAGRSAASGLAPPEGAQVVVVLDGSP